MNSPFTPWGDCLKQHAVGVLVRIAKEFYVRHACNPSLRVAQRPAESAPNLAKRPISIVVWVYLSPAIVVLSRPSRQVLSRNGFAERR